MTRAIRIPFADHRENQRLSRKPPHEPFAGCARMPELYGPTLVGPLPGRPAKVLNTVFGHYLQRYSSGELVGASGLGPSSDNSMSTFWDSGLGDRGLDRASCEGRSSARLIVPKGASQRKIRSSPCLGLLSRIRILIRIDQKNGMIFWYH